MSIKKFFEYFKSETSIEDVMDIFNEISDDYDVDVEFHTCPTDSFFPFFRGCLTDTLGSSPKRPEIGRYEAISKIIEIKTGESISPKFISSYISDHYNYSTSSQELKDYHKQFSDSSNYRKDIKNIEKYEYSITFLIILSFKYSQMGLVKFDFDPIFQRLKSMYDLDKIYFHKNNFLGNNDLITTIMVV